MKSNENKPLSGLEVCPVTGSNLLIRRNERELLNVPDIAFGTEQSVGQCTMVVGPNGAGKSVLVRALCNLLKPDSGSVHWARLPPDRARRHRVGLMLQKPVLLRRSALHNLSYALRQTGMGRRASLDDAESALQHAGLGHVSGVQAQQLSGGEQQRLALVRALLLEPDILFLDEATANVDPASTLVIEQQLRKAIAAGLTVIMVSHDTGQVKRMADHIVLMHKGRIIEHANREEFFERPRNILTKCWIAGELLV